MEANDKNIDIGDFITMHYNNQQQFSDVAPEKSSKFFERAMSESKRMNSEVERNEKQRKELEAEHGADKMYKWIQEHVQHIDSLNAVAPDQIGDSSK
ncbi:uncharacterized protein LOC117104710 [Anneissia japonica]|uniref:uncharacterized protein LOC117104710 n=1 Tax=Anneissia japonica TaxID=1529436 RepID=UPI001425A4C0|nr:uncharacterized protein LOC117104710 [Anneissia japonica]